MRAAGTRSSRAPTCASTNGPHMPAKSVQPPKSPAVTSSVTRPPSPGIDPRPALIRLHLSRMAGPPHGWQEPGACRYTAAPRPKGPPERMRRSPSRPETRPVTRTPIVRLLSFHLLPRLLPCLLSCLLLAAAVAPARAEIKLFQDP